ncbi:c-type cytochrome biogenesis protein CcmI [Pleionea sediminis]|uniref:c-type cytochrome biogenesis protein CcmI n=1 Tax=Pleionea sediminis TaxID=2569479 RepID=UPI001185DF9C|nr:c-type cytochrome biogenesis protein CcmI [Pleionea sediminis]
MIWVLLLISFVIAFCLYRFVASSSNEKNIDRLTLNTEVFRSRQTELMQDLEAERISQDEFDQLEAELKRSLLQDVPTSPVFKKQQATHQGVFISILVAIPTISLLLYYAIADWKAYDDWRTLVDTHGDKLTKEVVETDWLESLTNQDLILLLRSRLHENPEETRSWIGLAQTLAALGASAQSIQALERAIESAPKDLPTKMTAAQMLARLNSPQALALAKSLIEEILVLKPNHEAALAVSGFIYMQTEEFEQAITNWEKLVANREARNQGKGEGIEVIRQQIKRAKNELAQRNHFKKAAFGVTVNLSVDESVKQQFAPGTRVFIIVKGDDGMPAPVAVKPLTLSSLPVSIRLTDNDAMMPGRTMSEMKTLTLQARISQSGKATPTAGDFESEKQVFSRTDDQDISLIINQKVL